MSRWWAGKEPSVPTFTRSETIDRPSAAVWAVLEDVRRLPEFSRSTVEISGAPERLTAPGQTFHQVVRQVGRRFESEWRVLEIEAGRLLVIEGSVGFGVTYRLTEQVTVISPTSCRFSLTVDYRLPFGPLGRMASKLGVERLAEREAGEVVEGLKRLVEAGPSSDDAD
jgi:uncharacterized membrane protein